MTWKTGKVLILIGMAIFVGLVLLLAYLRGGA